MYEIRHYNPAGDLINVIGQQRFSKLVTVRVENDIGGLELSMPKGDFRTGDFGKCQILEVWRDGVLQGETAYFIQNYEFESMGGEETVRIVAADANWLLSTRIVAYAAGSAQAEMTYKADRMLREIMIDNFGADAIAARRLSNLTAGALLEDSVEITKGFSRRNVLRVMQEICEAAQEAGMRTYFDVVRTGVGLFKFYTYTGRRGEDHSLGSGDVRLVGTQYGNFDDVVLGFYHSREVNYVYAGGQGEEEEREIVEVSDANRIAVGYPFNRVESFVDARNLSATESLTAEARAGLAKGAPKIVLTGVLVETPGMRYGVHYGFGDVVSAEAFGYKVDCHVTSIRVTVDGNGEKIDCRLYGEEA